MESAEDAAGSGLLRRVCICGEFLSAKAATGLLLAMKAAWGAEVSSGRGGGGQLDLPSSFYFLKVIAVQIELYSALYMMASVSMLHDALLTTAALLFRETERLIVHSRPI